VRRESSFLKLGFVAPTLLFLITFNLYPLFYNIVLSFTNKQLSQDEYEFVGGHNYQTIFDAASNPKFGDALRTTGSFVLAAVTLELVLGFCLALAMQAKFRGKPLVLTVLLIPMMLSPAVMGLFWNLILSAHNGILNQGLGGLGLPTPHSTPSPATFTKPRRSTGLRVGRCFGASHCPCARRSCCSRCCFVQQTRSSSSIW
jgi:ABC-type sugar transport system permease subunit